jgi:hypothetical protein
MARSGTRRWLEPPRAAIGILLLITAVLGLSLVPPTEAGFGAEPVDLELAGLPLDAYPQFEYVKAFNVGHSVSIAIDPFRFPTIIGATCDIYIADARSAEEWGTNPDLADVRGAPQKEKFGCQGSCEITDLTVVLTSSHTINGDTGCLGASSLTCIGLGKPYDIVLDCNQDGELGTGDFIDGRGTEAGFYVVHDTVLSRLSTTTIESIDVVATNPAGNEFGLPFCLTYDYCTVSDFEFCSYERIVYPTDLSWFSEPLPLVVISHGSGHCFEWYDYLQGHLASYGYIVMSHQNSTSPGPGFAAETTLKHTDAVIDLINSTDCAQRIGTAHQDLCGRLDPTRIVWIGHSRGGQGVVRARSQLAADPQAAQNYGVNDIALISTMAPTDYVVDGQLASPEETPFHLIWGAGDMDVAGKPQPDSSDRVTMAFQILERARGPAQSVYFHGGAHGWFHEECGGAAISPVDCEFQGEPEVDLTEADVHKIVRGYFVPLLKHYLEGNIPAQDFFWRPWSRFRPESTIDAPVALEYHVGDNAPGFVIDDYETNHDLNTSSSGGAIVQTLDPEGNHPEILFEGLMEDEDCHFDFTRASLEMEDPFYFPPDCSACPTMECHCDPGSGPPDFDGPVPCLLNCGPFVSQQHMNGTTRSRDGGEARGVALKWPRFGPVGPTVYGYTIPPGLTDFSELTYLSFRVAQLPRHPNTFFERVELDFTVALVDGNGTASKIRFGAYEAGIVEPYKRYGPHSSICHCGGEQCCAPIGCNPELSDFGWQAEFETIRIRLTDFLTNGRELDLSNITTVRFEFGRPGSARGRIVIDDVEITVR